MFSYWIDYAEKGLIRFEIFIITEQKSLYCLQ